MKDLTAVPGELSAWTTGPWKVDRSHNGSLHVRGANGLPVAELWHTSDDREANAKLISLAPELAEALRMSESAINGFLNQCSDEEVRDSFGEFARATKAARAVLAKLK